MTPQPDHRLLLALCLCATTGWASAATTPENAPAPTSAPAPATAPAAAPPAATYPELPPLPKATAPAEAPDATHSTAAERASLLRIGATKLAAGDAASALIAYRQVAEATEDPEELVNALLGLGRAYRLGGDNVKAAATFEHLIKDYPDHPLTPAAYLDLGRALRDLGSPKLAIARFYSVLQTAIKFSSGDTNPYRRLALTAQFEIADTHLATGNYEGAILFFNRLNLLDLTPADQARARFKSAQARALSGDRPAAVLALQAFITQNPDDANSPEARFMLASILRELNRPEESIQVTLELLHHEHSRTDGNADQWRMWQQRTGNQLANEFYTQGEFTSALRIYQSLAALDQAPAWHLPVLYQIGLCYERLLQTKDALDTYQQMTKLIGDSPGNFADLARMVAWRTQQLTWLTRTQADLNTLLHPPPPTVATASP